MRKAKRLRAVKKRNVQTPRSAFFQKMGMWIITMLLLPVLVSVLSQCILLWLEHWVK